MHNFSDLFDKVLYTFQIGPLSIMRSIFFPPNFKAVHTRWWIEWSEILSAVLIKCSYVGRSFVILVISGTQRDELYLSKAKVQILFFNP